jgi:hypothetical protein
MNLFSSQICKHATCYLLICYAAIQICPLIFTVDLHMLVFFFELCISYFVNLLCACANQTRVLLAAVHNDTFVSESPRSYSAAHDFRTELVGLLARCNHYRCRLQAAAVSGREVSVSELIRKEGTNTCRVVDWLPRTLGPKHSCRKSGSTGLRIEDRHLKE